MTRKQQVVPILSGGGTRLPAHVGALQGFAELGLEYQHIVGVSGGSIVAAVLAAGHDVQRAAEIAIDTDYRKFRGRSPWRLLTTGGLSSGRAFESWMDEQIDGKRFSDLDLDLHVVATDLYTGLPVVMDRERTPDMKVSRAVRFSMGIPFVFAYQEWQGHLMIDGSILGEEALRNDWAGDGTPGICIRLRQSASPAAQPIKRLFPLPQLIVLTVRAFMAAMSREFVADAYWNTTLFVDVGDIPFTEFGLVPEQKRALLERGLASVRTYLPGKLSRLLAGHED